jgi:hypothetical protein
MQIEVKQPQQLQDGELYVVQHGELRRIERPPDDMPRVPISKLARERLLDLRRRCRKTLADSARMSRWWHRR